MSFVYNHRPRADRPSGTEGQEEPAVDDLVALAGRITKIRTARKELLPAVKFGEPGWDMIIALYLATLRDDKMTISNVCDASDAPPTTAFRWLDRLLQLKMVRRHSHPTDARVVYIELQPETVQLVEAFLRRAWSTFYPTA